MSFYSVGLASTRVNILRALNRGLTIEIHCSLFTVNQKQKFKACTRAFSFNSEGVTVIERR